jgi:hypothetical protein
MGGNQPTMAQCVQSCGCEPEIIMPAATEAQLSLIATIQRQTKPLFFMPIINQSKLTQDVTFVLQAFSSFIVCVGLFCAFAYNIDQKLLTKPSKPLQQVEADDQEFEPVEGQVGKVSEEDNFELQEEDKEEKIVL